MKDLLATRVEHVRRMYVAGIAISMLGIAPVELASQAPLGDAPVGTPAQPEARFAPSRFPDRVALTFYGDPTTEIAVTWRTDSTVTAPIVQITRATGSPELEATSRVVDATTRRLRAENGVAHHHSAILADLEPETLYAYRVGDRLGAWSEWYQYRTASSDRVPFSIIYFGDAQNDVRSLWSRAIREAVRDAPRASFVIHSGDLVNLREGNHDSEWGEWFETGGWWNAMVPSVPAAGNHEYVKADTADIYEALSPHWNHQFTLPRHGPEGLEGTVYHIDYQGMRVIALNSLHALEFGSVDVQADWLEGRLRDNPNPWTIVTFHHPLHSTREGRDNAELRARWGPLFEQYGVDLVLQGHDHAYGRGTNLMMGERSSGAAGPVYVVSVSGPKMYEIDQAATWTDRSLENTQLYQILHVDGERLTFEARSVAGDLHDRFHLVKRLDGRSALVEERADSDR